MLAINRHWACSLRFVHDSVNHGSNISTLGQWIDILLGIVGSVGHNIWGLVIVHHIISVISALLLFMA